MQPRLDLRKMNADRSAGSNHGNPHHGAPQLQRRATTKESPRSFALPGVPPSMYREWEEGHSDYKWEESKPRTEAKPRPPVKPKPLMRSATQPVVAATYLDAEVPLFGLQYGMSGLSLRERKETVHIDRRASSDARIPSTSKPGIPRPSPPRPSPSKNIPVSKIPSPPEDTKRTGKGDMERAFLRSLHSSDSSDTVIGLRGGNTRRHTLATLTESSAPATKATECMICVEPFTAVSRPEFISIACMHEPSVCSGCISRSIKSELESRMWNQIKCPECQTALIYDDIQRLADPETFARYDALSLRSVISADEKFVWCTKCSFGQLHASGNKQPLMRCLQCGHRSCFRHSVPWHERLTCEQYESLLKDPENFNIGADVEDPSLEKLMKAQEENNDQLLAEELARQKQVHAVERQRAKRKQQEEAERKREELEKKKKLENDRKKMIEDIKRRQKEDELSLQTVQATTKQCPNCQWPIEKNDGCAHMTCKPIDSFFFSLSISYNLLVGHSYMLS
ncbi:hypothetical protein F5884DRAFT_754151 [Xylogone sp. PMI_703]|nr:hypothetical protein F5884DRAFT_754151 [Xylogone sp. PMI_703]